MSKNHSFVGKLLRITYDCRRKCVILKHKGLFKYTEHYKNKTAQEKESLITSTSSLDRSNSSDSDYWMKLGIIAAIVSLMIVLCGVIGVVIHICHTRLTCRKISPESIILIEELTLEMDTHKTEKLLNNQRRAEKVQMVMKTVLQKIM